MDEEKDPFVDGIGAMVLHGDRRSLNEIGETLTMNEHLSYGDEKCKIFKVVYNRDVVAQAKEGTVRLLQYIAVEFTLGVFKDESA